MRSHQALQRTSLSTGTSLAHQLKQSLPKVGINPSSSGLAVATANAYTPGSRINTVLYHCCALSVLLPVVASCGDTTMQLASECAPPLEAVDARVLCSLILY
jgi:hypothetical protein